jgi:pimeloyl-ACP methyl ester carboxylesterase
MSLIMPHNLVFIHGANATNKSFNYILRGLTHAELDGQTTQHFFNYDSHQSFYKNLDTMHRAVDKMRGPIMLIAHSLGGIYSTHLYSHFSKQINRAVTLSTPYAGVANANLMQWVFPYHQLLQDVGSFSRPIVESHFVKVKIPWTQVVSTTGDTPWMNPFIKNDGVVSRYSMTHREDIDYYYVGSNHYEIVADPDAVDFITKSVTEFIS